MHIFKLILYRGFLSAMKKIRILMLLFIAVLGVCAARSMILSVSGTVDKKDEKYVIIDAGHGGADSGKVGVNGSLEKKLNLEITRKLEELLKAYRNGTIKEKVN